MSLTSSLQRIVSAKESIRQAIEDKGVTVASSVGIADYPSYIGAITGGGASCVLLSKVITANGVYSAVDDNADGYSEVTVSVPTGGGGDANWTSYWTKTLESVNDTNGDIKGLEINAFASQSMLSYAYLPSCSYVMQGAFMGCSLLQEVSFAEGCTVSSFKAEGWSTQSTGYSISKIYIQPSAIFSGCTSLSKITNLNLGRFVGSRMFYYCHELREMSLGLSTQNIREYAFQNCSKLSRIILPSGFSNILYIYDQAFRSTAIDENGIDLDICIGTNRSNAWTGLHFAQTSFKRISCAGSYWNGSGVFVSGFASCSLLSYINASWATYAATNMFGDCVALEEVVLPKVLTLYNGPFTTAKDGCTFSLPICATLSGFNYGLGRAHKLKLPAVGQFRQNYYYYLPLTYGSLSYREVYLNKLSQVFGNGAVYLSQNVSGYTMISMPKCISLTSYNCISLNNTYANSYKISIVLAGSSMCNMGAGNAIAPYSRAALSIYVPSSMVDTYKTATNWTSYANKIVALETLSIYFNYGGSKYWTKWGTTWNDFVLSDDNTGGFYINNDIVYDGNNNSIIGITASSKITEQDYEYSKDYITIDGVVYPAVSNQQWYQWLVDGHNTDGYKYAGGYLSTYIQNSAGSYIYDTNNASVGYFDIVELGGSYHT